MQATSKADIGSGKCIEFQNQKRFSSFSRRAGAKKAWYGYISSQPSQPGGVSIEYGLGNAPTGLDVANASPPLLDGCAAGLHPMACYIKAAISMAAKLCWAG